MKESTHKKLDKKLEKLGAELSKLEQKLQLLVESILEIQDELTKACEDHNKN